MGTIEASVRSRIRKGQIQRAVLSALAIGGILAVSMVAPNVVQLLGPKSLIGKRINETTKKSITSLQKKGYVVVSSKKGGPFIRLTKAGERFLEIAEHRSLDKIYTQKKWDGHWRLVIFDIPESRRKVRIRVATMLRSFGFTRLQDSVWVYPHDCEELIALLKADLLLRREVLYAVAVEIEHDDWLRRRFGV